MRIQKVKEVRLLNSKIIKVFNFSKIHLKIKEIYIVKIKGKIFRHWRQHINCNKILFCYSGITEIQIFKKNKIKSVVLKSGHLINIPKKTIFKFRNLSKKDSSLLVLSDVENRNLKTKKKFKFLIS